MFLRNETLRGSKSHVYILMKLLKSLTKARVTSYKIKWAVEAMLGNIHDLHGSRIGWAIRETIRHRSIREQFEGIHSKLQKLGYTGIHVTDIGFRFVAGPGKLQYNEIPVTWNINQIKSRASRFCAERE